jgi:hypothetical protein
VEDADNGVLHMAFLSKKSPVAPPLTTEEKELRLHEEIRNLRSSKQHLASHQSLRFAVMIELRERELASLRECPPKAAQEVAADGRSDAA